MTQKQFWIIALLCNVAFLFLYIFKQNALIAARQQLQAEEQKFAALQQRKKDTYNKLQTSQKHATIKKRAEQELGMRKADLKQINPLTSLEKVHEAATAEMPSKAATATLQGSPA